MSEPRFVKQLPELVNGIMESIFNFLMANGYTSGCGCCGDRMATLNP